MSAQANQCTYWSAYLTNQKMSTNLKTDLVGNVIFSSSSEIDFVSVDFNISEIAF